MSEAEKEIINWCGGLNDYYKPVNPDDSFKFPKVCEKVVGVENLALEFDVNENPTTDPAGRTIVNGPLWLVDEIKQIISTSPNEVIARNSLRYCCTAYNNIQKKQAVVNAKQDYEVSLKRAEATRDPAANISRYGTHFAFGKPLRFSTVPYLIAISIFFLVLGIGLLLEITGTSVQISTSGLSSSGGLIESFKSSWSQTTGSFKIILILISIVVGAVGYYGADKLKEYAQSKKE